MSRIIDKPTIGGYYKQLDDYGKELLIKALRLKASERDDGRKIISALCDLKKDEQLKALLAFYEQENSEAAAREFIQKYPLEENLDILCRLVKTGADVSAVLDENTNMPLCAGKFFTEKDGLFLIFNDYDFAAVKSDDGIQNVCSFFIYLMNMAAIRHRPLTPIFEIYGRITDGRELNGPTPEVKASRVIGDLNCARSAHDYKSCFEKLKEALSECPKLAEIITAYQSELMTEYNEYQQSRKNDEMSRLCAAVKGNIRAFISGGKAAEAVKTLSEYELINPSDPDIPLLKAELGI